MKYKVGDRVRIKSLDWYNKHTNGTEVDCGGVPFTSDMKRFCSRVMTISCVHADCYAMVEDLENYYTDEMIEGLVEEETVHNKWTGLKIELEKKNEYPKTYEECCKVLGIEGGRLMFNTKDITEYEENLIYKIGKLEHIKVCRDAYWKIAGEEMGLGKPWEPDWDSEYFIPAIIYRSGSIQKVEVQYRNAVFAFPTPEMRDAFYDNFKVEIKSCKKLL